MEPIEFEATITMADYEAATEGSMTPFGRSTVLVIGIATIAIQGYSILSGSSPIRWASFFQLFVGAYFVWMFIDATYVTPRRGTRPLDDNPWRFAMSESRIAFHTPQYDNSSPWSDYVTWREAAGTIVLSSEDESFIVVPKRAVPIGRLDDLLALLTEKLGPAT